MNTAIDQIIKLNERLGLRVTSFLSSLIFSSAFIYWILRPALSLQYLGYFFIVAVSLAAMLSISQKPAVEKPNKMILLCLLLLGFFYFVAAVRFRETGKLYRSLSFAVFVPLIMYLLSGKDSRARFIDAFANGSIVGLIFLSVASAFKAPIFDTQYSSILLNPNYLAATVSVFYVCLIYKLFTSLFSLSKPRVAMLSVCIGISLTLIILSESRTGLLCVAASSIAALIVQISGSKRKNKIRKLFKYLIAVALISIIVIPCYHKTISFVSSKIITFDADKTGQASFFTMESYETVDAEDLGKNKNSDATFSESLHSAIKRSGKGIDEDTTDISTGRFGIWKSCIDSLNLRGHSDSEKFYAPYRDAYINDTHNMFLAVGFGAGYPAMIALIAYMICCFMLYFRTMRSFLRVGKFDRAAFFFLVFSPVFFIEGMLSDSFLPTLSIVGVPFWFNVPLSREY